jgi:hypothetical protein
MIREGSGTIGYLLAALLVAALVLAIVSDLTVRGRARPERSDVGPQATVSRLRAGLPPLRIPRMPYWDREDWRILIRPEPGRLALRTSRRPASEDPVLAFLAQREADPDAVPPEQPGNTSEWPAFHLCASADAPGELVLKGVRAVLLGGAAGRVYLAGTEAGGTVGAVPLVHSGSTIRRLAVGAPLTRDHGQSDVVLRITREGEEVRYRWSPAGDQDAWAPTWGGGDVRVSAEEAEAPGKGPLVPELAAALGRVVEGSDPDGISVALQVGTGVRYVDVLRAVECGTNDHRISFLPFPWSETSPHGGVLLPRPGPPPPSEILAEGSRGGPGRIEVEVHADGTVRREGASVDFEMVRSLLESLRREHEAARLLLLADERAPWTTCAWAIELAFEKDVTPEIAYRPEDPGIPIERVLGLSPVEEGMPVVTLAVRPGEGGRVLPPDDPPEVKGKGVVLTLPRDAMAGDPCRIILDLVRRGAAGLTLRTGD